MSILDVRRYLNDIPDKRVARIFLNILDKTAPTGDNVNLTAYAGGGQTDALLLSDACTYHEVGTVATADDSIALPVPDVGDVHIVNNSATNSMQVFGVDPVTIDGVATGTGVPHPGKATVVYACVERGNYIRVSGIASAMVAALSGITAGVAAANKAVVLGASKEIATVGAITTDAPITYDHNTTITAYATGGQTNATALTGEFNNVTTCATAGDSVKLPAAALGKSVTVKNSGATSLAVFPATGDAINALAVNLSVNVPVGAETTFRAIDGTTYETNEAFVSSGPTTQRGEFVFKASDNAADHEVILTNASHGQATTTTIPDPAGATGTVVLEEITNVFDLPQRYDANTTITAFATGGQGSATALTGEYNNVTTVATAGDSVKLPAAAAGLEITVKNSGATSLAVFPATDDSINALAADLSVNIPVGGELTFRAKDATVWETNEALVLPAPTTQSGELVFKAADNAADHEIVVTNASHGQATTHTIPDPGGATASFVITEGAQTVNGAKTFSSTLKTSSGVGAVAGAGVTVVESGDGVIHQSVFTFDYTGANDFDLADGADHGTGRQFYDFPEGRIFVLGATCNLSFTATAAGNGGATYPFAVGTVTAADDGTLTGTEADIIPSTAVAYNGGAAQAVGQTLATAATFDGTGTAKDLFFNVAVTDAVSSAAVTVAATGTATVTWINLGDYA